MKRKKLPISLLTDANNETKMNILDIEKYEVIKKYNTNNKKYNNRKHLGLNQGEKELKLTVIHWKIWSVLYNNKKRNTTILRIQICTNTKYKKKN